MNVPDAATQPQLQSFVPDAATQPFPPKKKKNPSLIPVAVTMTAHCCRLHLQAVNAALQASPAVQRFTPCLELERSVGSLHAVLSRLPSAGLLRKAAHLSSVSGHAIHGCPQTLGFGAMLCVQQLLVASYTGASWPSDVVISLQYSQTSMLRPYHPEHTPSRPIREVKLDWAQLILG